LRWRLNILWSLLGWSVVSATTSVKLDTPENAVRSLEQAYIHEDVDAAVATKDFREEARLMLNKLNPEFATDPKVVRQAAEVLELAFRKEMKTKGFPKFKDLKCSFLRKEEVSPTLVKLTEECVFPDGGKSHEDIYVTKSKVGWRVIVMPD
jgi:hypothetical protein